MRAEVTRRTDEGARPLLVAVDFSPTSKAALVWAAQRAAESGAQLVVLHVVHEPARQPGFYERGNPVRRLDEVAAEMMDRFLVGMTNDHPEIIDNVEKRLVRGLPTTRIAEVADQIGAAMIVMGCEKKEGFGTWLRRPRAEKVGRLSTIPVKGVPSEGTRSLARSAAEAVLEAQLDGPRQQESRR